MAAFLSLAPQPGQRDPDLERAALELQDTWGVRATAVLGCSDVDLHLGGLRRGQRTLAAKVREERTRRLQGAMPEAERNWLQAASTRPDALGAVSPGASDWLTAPLTAKRTQYGDDEWSALVRARFMLPLAAEGACCKVFFRSTQTTCSEPLEPRAWHVMGCAPAQRVHRHDDLRDELAAVAREAGLHVETEAYAAELPAPVVRGRPVHRRADVRVAASAALPLTFLDLTVTATPHFEGCEWCVLGRGVRVRALERDKVDAWDAAGLGDLAPRVVPFAFESQGRWAPAAVLELRRWAKARGREAGTGAISAAAARGALLRRWRTRLSCALARGTARMLLAGLRSPAGSAGGLGTSDEPLDVAMCQ